MDTKKLTGLDEAILKQNPKVNATIAPAGEVMNK